MRVVYEGINFRSVKEAVLYRDKHRCVRCGSGHNLTYDHVMPKCKGGQRTIENGQTLCESCNVSKGARDNDEWRAQVNPKTLKRKLQRRRAKERMNAIARKAS